MEIYLLELYLRNRVDDTFLRPLARMICDRTALSACHLTCMAGVLGGLVIPVLWMGQPIMAILLLLVSGLLDALDGLVARLTETASDKGAVLDIVMDRWVEACVLVALMGVAPVERGWLCLMMGLSVLLCVTSFLVVGIFEKNSGLKSFHYSPGLMERPEAFAFFMVMMAFPDGFEFLAGLFCVLVVWTSICRLYEFFSH